MAETAGFTTGPHFGQVVGVHPTATATATAMATTTTAAITCTTSSAKTQLPLSYSGPSPNLHSHRQNHSSSKLPGFRIVDLQPSRLSPPIHSQPQSQSVTQRTATAPQHQPVTLSSSSPPANPVLEASPSLGPDADAEESHQSTTKTTLPAAPPPPLAVVATTTTATHRAQELPASGLVDPQPPRPQLRSRASSDRAAISSPLVIVEGIRRVKRPASLPDSLVDGDDQSSSALNTTLKQQRRPPASCSSNGAATSGGPPPTLNAHRRQAVEAINLTTQTPQTSPEPQQTEERGHAQRESLPSNSFPPSSPPNDSRSPPLHRPPVSYKPPINSTAAQPGASTPVRVPPIRSFRSSGYRKSLTPEMNYKSRPYGAGDDGADPSYEHTFRAADAGRYGSEGLNAILSSSRQRGFNGDDTGDVFLKIAREEPTGRTLDENLMDDNPSTTTTSRAFRSSHRRPLSTNVAAYHPTSPPPVVRRLSDQQDRDRARSRRHDDDQGSEVSRPAAYRSFVREKAASVHPLDRERASSIHPLDVREKAASAHPLEDTSFDKAGNSTLRPSRTQTLYEQGTDASSYGRKRTSAAETNATSSNRAPTHKALGQGKTYSSSPLVKSFDLQNQNSHESANAIEGTASTTSTTAPSTVWDELDDLKSRIHRLELTGKLPSTSGAAVSRLTDERPPTATTTVTTMSLSPKKTAANQQGDAASATSSQPRENNPILHSALAKSKSFLSTEVFRALEAAANDAIMLSSMMGAPGQPGPISSGVSTAGPGAMVTDRQLRRRAESVCRSLTELCIALSEDSAKASATQPPQSYPVVQNEAPVTPNVNKTLGGPPISRRSSVAAEHGPPVSMISPRTMSKFEERRNSILNGNTLPSPRFVGSTPSTPNESGLSRRSSLMVARTRRAGTEEPDDGRRSSLLLRTRRAGTEEPEEGRKTSLLVRGRRGTAGEEGEELRFRAPSRSNTDSNTIRKAMSEHPLDAQPSAADTSRQISSPPTRRRFISSNLHTSRLATPAIAAGAPPRKYLERSALENDGTNALDKPVDERGSRHMSIGQTFLHSRTTSLHSRRPTRDSMLAPLSPTTGAGGYR